MSNDNKTLADVQPGGRVRLGDRPKDGEVIVEVSGLTGSGKSAIAGEIEILCKALGLEVEWVNGDEEKCLTHADWIGALEMYKPKVMILERNVSRSPDTRHQACDPSLATAARAAIPFVAYAFSEGVDGAEEAGRAIESALSAQPSPGGQDASSQVVSKMVSTAPEKIFLQVGDGDYSDEPFPHPVGEEITWCSDSIVESEVAYVRADLSAQPSPGGQDALVEAAMIIANAAHDRALMSDILSGMRAHEAQSLKSAILALDAALAAREPVYVQGCDELRARTEGERAAYMEGLEEGGKIAARQPVGEPVAWMTHHDEPMLFPTAAEAAAYCEDDEQPAPLFRQPAQAVDLGRWSQRHADDLHVAVHTALSVHAGSLSQKKRAAISAYVKRLLIDSQAVGNGQPELPA